MIFKKTLAAITVAAALGVAAAPTAFAGPVVFEHGPNLVTNGGFESGDFTGWTLSNDDGFNGVDGSSPNSGAFAAFLGNVAADGLFSLSQTLATSAGQNYNIHFSLAADVDTTQTPPAGLTPNQFTVLWNGVTVWSASDISVPGYVDFVIDPMATGALTTLEFLSLDNPAYLHLDDVSVRQVPEPLTLALLGAGLFGMGWSRRKAA